MLRTAPRREIVASLPLDRVVTESDGPFTKADGRVARPEDVGHTVEALARVYKVDAARMADVINSNLRTLVSVQDD
jgi:TatD DNase family protein